MYTATFRMSDPDPNPTDKLADVVLRSSDGVDLRTSKLLLTLASPFFELMFTLPQPQTSSTEGALPVVQMTESKTTLHLLLAFCSPRWFPDQPSPSTLADVQSVLDAAIKYEMDGLATHVRSLLLSAQFLAPEPMRVAAVACKYRWEHGLRHAARQTLSYSAPPPFAKELEYMTAAQYHHLESYRAACVDAAVARASEARWLACDDSFVWARCADCVKYLSPDSRRYIKLYPQQRRWWMDCRADYCAALRALPDGVTVLGAALIKSSKERAHACGVCREHAGEDLLRFGNAFAREIDEAVAKVSLVVCF